MKFNYSFSVGVFANKHIKAFIARIRVFNKKLAVKCFHDEKALAVFVRSGKYAEIICKIFVSSRLCG